MKRKPLRGIVRIKVCRSPLSPTALRAALMRLVSVEFGDDAPVPDRGDQIVLADHAVAVFDQEDQQIEDLRLQRKQRAVPPQLAAIGVKCMICKEELHDGLAQ